MSTLELVESGEEDCGFEVNQSARNFEAGGAQPNLSRPSAV